MENSGCLHVGNDISKQQLRDLASFFRKLNYKKVQSDGTIVPGVNDDVHCVICTAYEIRASVLQARIGTRFPYEVDDTLLNTERYEAKECTSSDIEEMQWLNSPGNPISFRIEKNQNGEMYHGVICAVLYGAGVITIDITNHPSGQPEKKATEVQGQFVQYYAGSCVMKTGNPTSKSIATEYIARAFAADKTSAAQARLFASIRTYLDFNAWKLPPITQDDSGYGIAYSSPSYSGKFWINRFFQLTQQTMDPASGRTKLMKPTDPHMAQIAVILIRRGQAADDVRTMDDENLAQCVQAVIDCNVTALAAHETCFTHILLFGDVDIDTPDILRRRLNGRVPAGLPILYLNAPFHTIGPKKSALATRINEFWNLFKGRDPLTSFSTPFEGLPLEVKYFSFFLALQNIYAHKLCYIGFRSGTIDGPGFIGSPIFYLDDTAAKDEPAYNKLFATGQYLWDADHAGATINERMAQMTRAANTFVRINVPPERRKGVLNLGERARWHLATALYMYMIPPAGAMPAEPLWLQRLEAMESNVAQLSERLQRVRVV